MFTLCALAAAIAQEGDRVPEFDPKVGRRLIWSDEFSRRGRPSSKRWRYEVGKIRNNEVQYYTDGRAENARVEHGNLVIEARKEKYSGSDVTSASLQSVAAWTYGFFEVRAKIPLGRGTWPAIWFLGEGIRKTGPDRIDWPLCGEIDLMESVGFDPESLHFNIHTASPDTAKPPRSASVKKEDASSAYHVYGLDWRPERLDMYLDGQKVLTYPNLRTGASDWPFDKPAFMILNLAIGGAWGGQQGVDDAIFPSRFLVDYVRVYQ